MMPPHQLLPTTVQLLINEFGHKIKRQQITDTTQLSIKTLELIQHVIGKHKYTSITNLLAELQLINRILLQNNPMNLCISNTVRRVLSIIRTECNNQHTIENISYKQWAAVKSEVLDELNILSDEIKSSNEHISEQSIEHIHSRDVVLVYGYSITVLEFLVDAKKLRNFEVVVCETAPYCTGHLMCTKLCDYSIECTLITDSAIYALMSVINKVIINACNVLANGSITCSSGGLNIATVAKQFNIPFIVLCGLHQLSPQYIFNKSTIQQYGASNDLIPLNSVIYIDNTAEQNKAPFNIINPLYDYVPPELISLFITNVGGHHPSYLYRLMSEYYDTEDYNLDKSNNDSNDVDTSTSMYVSQPVC